MTHDGKISVVINTYNAERFLRDVLEALKGFDEIVVCDMESSDQTLPLAREYGCRIVTFPRGRHTIVEPARNFAIGQVSHRWVLVVDADEIVTPELRDYLYGRIAEADCPQGIMIPRLNKFLGRYVSDHSADHQLRFFDHTVTHWPETIHAQPQVKGRVEKIPKNKKNIQFLHLADETMTEYMEKANRYTDYDKEKKLDSGYGAFALFYRPLWCFFRIYVLQGAWRDGIRGLIRAMYKAVYQWILCAKVIEHRL